MQAIQGLHHITAIAGDAQANVDFYQGVLGQRLIKTTVNFDDVGTYHLYYGDEIGTPGTVMTFFPWRHVGPGRRGNGETSLVSYAAPLESIGFWVERLESYGVTVTPVEEHFGEQALLFHDPDGLALGIVATAEGATVRHWREGPVPELHALRGFHGVTLWVDSIGASASVLRDQLGYEVGASERARHRLRATSRKGGLFVDLEERPGAPKGAFGAGSVHHVAFRTSNDEEQLHYRQKLIEAGLEVTPVQDRQYFHSIYFREPGGVLYEVATDAPGFLYDEPIESLGGSLKLPPWLEADRARIESRLVPLVRRQSGPSQHYT